MDWMSGFTIADGVIDEMVANTGAILAGRRGYDAGAGDPDMKAYGGAWSGPIFVLTHHPEDTVPDPAITSTWRP